MTVSADIFGTYAPGMTTPIVDMDVIDYSSADQVFRNVTRGLHLSTGGTLVMVLKSGTTVTMILEAGWHPIRAISITKIGSSGAVGHGCW